MSWWKSLFKMRSVSAPERMAAVAVAEARVPLRDLPQSFSLPSTGGPSLFDPALKHYPQAYRQGDPSFDDPAQRQHWLAARARAHDHVLRAIAASPWSQHLVLRGSATMPAWIGDVARRPGDLDWVVLPETWGARGAEADALLRGFIDAIAACGARIGDVEIDVVDVACDEIWAYERAEGKRLTFAWAAPDLPPGKLQCDVVFREPLWAPPIRHALPLSEGDSVELLVAGPEQALAWKILWLTTDWYPQGKDLYDAVLLADRYALSEALLARTLQAICAQVGDRRIQEKWGKVVSRPDAGMTAIAWNDFVAEYPWIDPDLDRWVERFRAVLQPLIARDIGPAAG